MVGLLIFVVCAKDFIDALAKPLKMKTKQTKQTTVAMKLQSQGIPLIIILLCFHHHTPNVQPPEHRDEEVKVRK